MWFESLRQTGERADGRGAEEKRLPPKVVFHRALYRSSVWRRGLAIAKILHAAVAPYVALYTEGLGGGAGSDAEHRRLLVACRADDVDAALWELRQHLDQAELALVTFLAGDR